VVEEEIFPSYRLERSGRWASRSVRRYSSLAHLRPVLPVEESGC
jgi:hypothetical protein